MAVGSHHESSHPVSSCKFVRSNFEDRRRDAKVVRPHRAKIFLFIYLFIIYYFFLDDLIDSPDCVHYYICNKCLCSSILLWNMSSW
jgi:hypothetical protein